jgi:hypothetical protein
MVIALARMLELYLYQVSGIGIAWHISEPVVGVQLTILTSDGMFAEPSVATGFYFEFFFHFLLLFRYSVIS